MILSNKNQCPRGAKNRAKFALINRLFMIIKYGKLFMEFFEVYGLKIVSLNEGGGIIILRVQLKCIVEFSFLVYEVFC